MTAALDAETLAGWALPSVGGLGLVGLVLLVALRVRRGPRPWAGFDAALALVVMLWVSGLASLVLFRLATGHWLPGEEPPVLPAVAGTATGGAAAVAVVLLRARAAELGLGAVPWRWTVGAAGFVLPFLAASAAWMALLDACGVVVEEQRLLGVVRDRGDLVTVAVAVGYGALAAPVIEEVLFRGFLLPPLLRRWGPGAAVVGTALIFGVLHGGEPVSVPPLVLLGLVLGWLRVRTGSLWPALALHGANNAVAMVIVMGGIG